MKTARKLAVAVALATGATAAVADPLTQLFFSQDAGWLNPEQAYNGGGELSFNTPTGAGAPADTFTNMTWTGADSGESSISITGFTSDATPIALTSGFAADGDGEWNEGDIWSISQLLQTNNVIFGGPFPNPLWIAEALANFRVFDDAVGGNLVAADLDSSVEISFWETLNTDDDSDDADCASPSPLYDSGVTSTTPDGRQACDDIFNVPLEDFDPIAFNIDGFRYQIDFAIIDGVARDDDGNIVGPTLTCFESDPFPEALCSGEGVTPDDGSIAVYTPEFAPGTTDLFIAASWSVRPVPAPAVLGLLGIGFLAFGARRRKA